MGRAVVDGTAKRSLSSQGTWVAQSVRHLTLDFGSRHDLAVRRSSPASGSVLSAQSLLGILPLSLSLCPSLAFSLSKKKKNTLKKHLALFAGINLLEP